jgi:hypothetical protein
VEPQLRHRRVRATAFGHIAQSRSTASLLYSSDLELGETIKLIFDTVGAHRRGQIVDILNNPKISDDAKEALRRNAVDVKIVFEASRSDSHQDFADCGKAKSIPKSLVTTFDVRDKRNERTRELVKHSPFLSAYVDATASNVNLSEGGENVRRPRGRASSQYGAV